MTTFVHSVYTLILALWVGGISLFTFYRNAEHLQVIRSRCRRGDRGKLFPGYFIFTLVLSALALLALPLCKSLFGQTGYRWSLLLSVIAVAINVFVYLKLYPKIRLVKQEVHSFQPLPEDSPARKTFRKLHAVSATLNLILLADGVTLLIISTAVKR